ncbi:hypothetical protein [Hellea balneolensis]|uniref:hypothetical protein n=1 Tax=Hellea balneolensis TaxID=287478 RepID=UPI00041B65D6|nr:hypothetical protein [Hellea balneolensis]
MRHFLISTIVVTAAGFSGCANAQNATDMSKKSKIENQRVPYSSERVCRETCGMSKIDLSVKDLIINPGNDAQKTYPRGYLDTPYEDLESRRRTLQNAALEAINKDYHYPVGVPVKVNFYFEVVGSEDDNQWRILKSDKFKYYGGSNMSEIMKERILEALAELNHIKILSISDGATEVIKLIDPDFPYMERRQIYDKNALVFTIPLFGIKDVQESNILYFPNVDSSGRCENPNTHFIREIVPMSDIGKRVINAKREKSIISGRFTSCVWIKEWTASSTLPVLHDINGNN